MEGAGFLPIKIEYFLTLHVVRWLLILSDLAPTPPHLPHLPHLRTRPFHLFELE